jgi:hypothetical protein
LKKLMEKLVIELLQQPIISKYPSGGANRRGPVKVW